MLQYFTNFSTNQAWVNYMFNQLQLNYNYMTFDKLQLQLQSGKLHYYTYSLPSGCLR